MLPTGLGAFAAVFGHIGVAHLIARFRAGCAYRRTGFARVNVQRRMPENEVAGRMADLCAILQKPDVLRTRVLSASLQAVLNRVQTGIVTFLTVVQAVVQLLR